MKRDGISGLKHAGDMVLERRNRLPVNSQAEQQVTQSPGAQAHEPRTVAGPPGARPGLPTADT